MANLIDNRNASVLIGNDVKISESDSYMIYVNLVLGAPWLSVHVGFHFVD